MRLTLQLVILSVVALSQAEVLKEPLLDVLPLEEINKAPLARANLNVGFIGAGDSLLYSAYVYRPFIANQAQTETVVWRSNYNQRISAIRALELGATQYATVSIFLGGVGYNNVSMWFESARGWGYYYLLEIWGR